MRLLSRSVLIVACLVFAACGGTSPTSPSSSGTSTASSSTVTALAVTCVTVNNAHQCTAAATRPDATSENVTTAATWTSSTPAVATVDASGHVVHLTPGTTDIRATYQGLTGSLSLAITVEAQPSSGATPPNSGGTSPSPGETSPNPVETPPNPGATPPSVVQPSGGSVVINEFRLLGLPDYGDHWDQYLELRNDSSAPVDIGGWKIVTQASGGSTKELKVLKAGITLAPGCHYLLATNPSSLKIAVDDRWGVNQTGLLPWREGGVALQRPDGSIVDRVGWGSVPSFFEGVALAKPGTFEAGQFTRIGNDTDNNRADFVDAARISPQNSSSSCSIR